MKTLACLAVMGASAVTAVAFTTPSRERNESKETEVGRYELEVPEKNRLYLLDTKTGRIWSKYAGNPWRDVSSPVIKPTAEKPPK